MNVTIPRLRYGSPNEMNGVGSDCGVVGYVDVFKNATVRMIGQVFRGCMETKLGYTARLAHSQTRETRRNKAP
jgi:hypothetical protein